MASDANPKALRAAMEASDHAGVLRTLAPDVVLRSPVFKVPFEGREQVGELYEVLLEVFDDIVFEAEIDGDPHVLVFSSEVRGEEVQGVDLVRTGPDGLIAEMTVFLRPLPGIAAFLDAAGPLMAKRQSKLRAFAMRALGPPPSAMMRLVARMGPRMLGMKRAGSKD